MHTPRGPLRWERARRNARKHPTSPGANLYRARVKLAHTIASGAAEPLAPFEHRMLFSPQVKRAYCTCSAFCAAMQMQLDQATTDLERLNYLLLLNKEFYQVRELDTTTLARDVRCQVCAERIAKS